MLVPRELVTLVPPDPPKKTTPARGVGRPTDKGGGTTITDKNEADHILARLKRDDPELARQVRKNYAPVPERDT